jgi:hypothetical protein
MIAIRTAVLRRRKGESVEVTLWRTPDDVRPVRYTISIEGIAWNGVSPTGARKLAALLLRFADDADARIERRKKRTAPK